MDESKEIIIIGGGIAGLSAGIYALRNGYRATIIESHDKTGGQLTAWTREPYTFDYCLHWLVGSDHGALNEIWREIGAIRPATKTINHEIFSRIVDEDLGGAEFLLYCDADQWEAHMKELAPEDSKGIHRLCGMVRRAKGAEAWMFENPPELRSAWDYCRAVARSATFLPTILKYRKSTCRELIEDLGLKNEKLRGFLGRIFGADVGDFPALAMIMVMGWQHSRNAGYLRGGSRRMARLITDKYKSLGGELKLGARVDEIIVEDDSAKGVKLESGKELRADHIISACDGHTVLYKMLRGRYLPPVFREAYEEWPLFDPWVMVSFGIDEAILSKVHNTVYATSGRDGKQLLKIGRTPVKEYTIMNRTMYDPTFAPKGKTVLLLFFESPWDLWEDLTDEEEYTGEKAAIQERCTRLLEEKYAGITEHVEVVDVATPRTEVRYTGVRRGAFEGFLPRMDMLDGLPMELDGLENFSMVGQWVFPGGGLPPSAQSGRWAIQRLVKKEGRIFRHKAEEDGGELKGKGRGLEIDPKLMVLALLLLVAIVLIPIWTNKGAWNLEGGKIFA